ncbi:tRNA (adenosine(37)-N6)-threonylcarbamoyltransferase complex dimerization subunit type 1 TsaB [Bradymonas sediminis]|uniref:tRNA (Adenosine(37)-N6)-threonylcarbamoyltransferase complex dimerization subunit type 1 TsaB n=1 Tax=Bradymonas sediminis TaxID=1548548 RepID=A0A2Z4FN69_9DELT|nr:tRNA (adenosine(37)-N6)-threonylcarbamoyltransferase complex dimerization subunit type 1 TsaB [Bradymonas sediminis]AWV90300.1 tRNA (adenosine(37)-N6)-threonylcarbamoyltransferase complex dimerization subunit type 1 TsaB [Bradymonas sediminis]TDP75728.1 tRNA threonylcarbamoyladenosine biosynthesis protein TsaB [Bradymonas sediminis]
MTTAKKTDNSPRRVLAIDTATRTQSLALLDGETVLEHSQQRVKFNHGSSLLERIARMLEAQQMQVSDLDLIAVGRGPGSFTGLRVGVSIAKSLSRAKEIPLVGVSTLASLAHAAACAHPTAAVCATIDARRREVYTGLYALNTASSNALEVLDPDRTAANAELGERLLEVAQTRPVIMVGEGPHKYDELAALTAPGLAKFSVTALAPWAAVPSAVAIALLGRRAAEDGQLDAVNTLEPNYIRPTEAEIKFG